MAQRVGGVLAPQRAAGHDEWPLGRLEQRPQVGERGGVGARRGGCERRRVGRIGLVALHVLRQADHDRARPARGGHVERAADQLGDARGVVDLEHLLGQRLEHGSQVDLLERLPVALLAGHLADEQDHRRRVLERGVDADAGMRRTGAAGDQADAGPTGQLAVGLRHVGRAALVPRGDEADAVAVRIEAVEQADVALAGDAERQVDAVDDQLVGEELSAAAAHASGSST